MPGLTGRRVEPAELEPRGPRIYERLGVWTSEPLDSEIPFCQWHRIELELGRLPARTSVEVQTYADESVRPPDEVPAPMWETHRVTGGMQPGAGEPASDEFLVQSRPGRYLRIRVVLHADGYSSPVVRATPFQRFAPF